MEETLKLLYQLQLVDSNLDELEEMKGDLPSEVNILKEELDTLTAALQEKQDLIISTIMARDKSDIDLLEFKEKLEKYKKQQYQVRNNKEYDAITKEIEFSEKAILDLQKQFESFESTMTSARDEAEEYKIKVAETQKFFKEKQKDLQEVSKANEDEELKLKHKREKIAVRLKKDLMSRYERIRKGRNGNAVVPVRRHSCGGCHNKIPPQQLLELKRSNKIYNCERCGRIVVSEDIAKATTLDA